MLSLNKRSRLAAAAVGCSLAVAACGGGESAAGTAEGGSDLTGTIQVDGSSTVAPLTSAAAELFEEENPGVKVVVGTSGTGGGFEKFCGGETDISNASRSIKEEEAAACKTGSVGFQEVAVANDALSVVVNPANDWAECLTVEQLKKIWEPDSTIDNWQQVDPAFPDEDLTLYGPGTDSGTFDYFTDEINGEEGASRTDYQPSEDDNQIVTGIQGSEGALGYFGLSYVEENEGAVKTVEVDGGEGCVAPSAETALDGTYKPLSRPLFIYPSDKAAARPEVKAFLDFYVENQAEIAEEALFIPLSDEQAAEAEAKIAELAGA